MMLLVAKHSFNLQYAKNPLIEILSLCVGTTVGLLLNQGLSNGINRVTPDGAWAIEQPFSISQREEDENKEDENDEDTPNSAQTSRQPVVLPINRITRPQERIKPFNLNS